MRSNLCTLLLILVLSPLVAINGSAGTKGFQFLKLNYSAKALGMANAFTGQSDDCDAVFFNPAGLAKMKMKTVKTFYSNYIDGMNGGALVFCTPTKKNINIGIYTQFLTSGDIKKTVETSSGGYLEDGTFSTSDFLIGINSGFVLNKFIDLGFGIKYALSTLESHSASVLSADLGLIHQTNNKNLLVGLAVKNLGSQLTYYTENKYKEELPITANLGFHYLFSDKLIGNLDICRPIDNDFYVKMGTQYSFNEIFAVRAGFDSRTKDYKAGGDYESISGLSTGFSINYKRYSFDYGLASYGDLGFNNLLSIGYKL